MTDDITTLRAALAAGPTRRPIPFAPGYEADENGGIWSVSHNWRGYGERQIVAFQDNNGYLRVRVSVDGKRKKFAVHRLVCCAFYGEPAPEHEVRHLDGTKTNNSAANLAWGTRSENARDRARHGTDAAPRNARLGGEAIKAAFAHLERQVACYRCGAVFATREWKITAAKRLGRTMMCSAKCAKQYGAERGRQAQAEARA